MAMEDEEARPVVVAAKALDRMGVEDLQRYIAELRAEIARAEALIASRQGHRSAADSLFKFR